MNSSYVTDAPVEQVAEACRKLLVENRWEPYGNAGDVQFFKQNAIRLAARVFSAPAQGGKTVIDFSTVLMSADLPAPNDTENLQYTDTLSQLSFDTKATPKDLVAFYRPTLATTGWESTRETSVEIDSKEVMIFRNPQKDMLRLEMTAFDGKSRVLLTHQSAAEIAEIERHIKEDHERRARQKGSDGSTKNPASR